MCLLVLWLPGLLRPSSELDSVRYPNFESFEEASVVVEGFDAYANSISQRVVTGVDVVPMSSRPSNGISIRDPEYNAAGC